jgi:hypothetical protein
MGSAETFALAARANQFGPESQRMIALATTSTKSSSIRRGMR